MRLRRSVVGGPGRAARVRDSDKRQEILDRSTARLIKKVARQT
ncbi:hypothetical protein [Mycobacterium syngnathidarum]|nr:hypothetical protein [Mycobacterium syngnathidarum]